jgi:DNA-binding transcriptional regulator YdaS (Cro superfamily)
MAHKIPKLKSWLKGKDRAEFARWLNIHPGYLNMIVSGHRRASVDLAHRIELLTRGEVTFREILLPGDEAHP